MVPAVSLHGMQQRQLQRQHAHNKNQQLLARHALQWQWLHLAGPNDVEKVKQAYAKLELKAVVYPFFTQMALALGVATACVSRAGASSLAEIAARVG